MARAAPSSVSSRTKKKGGSSKGDQPEPVRVSNVVSASPEDVKLNLLSSRESSMGGDSLPHRHSQIKKDEANESGKDETMHSESGAKRPVRPNQKRPMKKRVSMANTIHSSAASPSSKCGSKRAPATASAQAATAEVPTTESKEEPTPVRRRSLKLPAGLPATKEHRPSLNSSKSPASPAKLTLAHKNPPSHVVESHTAQLSLPQDVSLANSPFTALTNQSASTDNPSRTVSPPRRGGSQTTETPSGPPPVVPAVSTLPRSAAPLAAPIVDEDEDDRSPLAASERRPSLTRICPAADEGSSQSPVEKVPLLDEHFVEKAQNLGRSSTPLCNPRASAASRNSSMIGSNQSTNNKLPPIPHPPIGGGPLGTPPPPPGAPLPPPGGPPPPPSGGGPPLPGGKSGHERATRALRLEKLQPKGDIEATLWGEEPVVDVGAAQRTTSLSRKELLEMMKDEKERLTTMFAKSVPKPVETEASLKAKVPFILDQNREKNVGIVLQVLKESIDSIERHVLQLETSPTFCEDAVASLLTICPQAVDLKAVEPYQKLYAQRHMPVDQQQHVQNMTFATVSPPVQFFLMAATIPDFQQRLECWHTVLSFERQADEIRADMKLMRDSVTYIRTSTHFPRVLELILTLGNFLNTGGDLTGSMVAKHFSMSDLKKVTSLRTTDNKSTLLEYLVDLVSRREPAAHAFAEELVPLIKNITSKPGCLTKLDFESLTAAVRALGMKIRACQELLRQPDITNSPHLSTRQVRTAGERLRTVLGTFLERTGEAGQHALVQEMDILRRQCVSFSEYLGEEVKGPFPTDLQTPVKAIGDFARDYGDLLAKRQARLARAARMKLKKRVAGRNRNFAETDRDKSDCSDD